MFKRGTIFVNTLDTLDCAVFDRHYGVSGRSWCIDVQGEGSGDGNYFVYDFSKFKQEIKSLIRETLDHRLIVPTCPAVRRSATAWLLETQDGTWSYICPSSSVAQLPVPEINIKTVTTALTALLQQQFRSRLKISLTLREAEQVGYSFSYTHGLPGHDGNCQRMLHGHSGTLQVHSDGERQPQMENYLATYFLADNIHFFNSDHIIVDSDYITAAYEGSQGYFQATMPRTRVVVLPAMETSIEAITHHLAAALKRKFTLPAYAQIVCYEGIDKGAVAPSPPEFLESSN